MLDLQMFVRILTHPGHGSLKCFSRRQLDFYMFLKKKSTCMDGSDFVHDPLKGLTSGTFNQRSELKKPLGWEDLQEQLEDQLPSTKVLETFRSYLVSEQRTRLLTTQREWCRKPTTDSGWALRRHINHIKRAKGLSIDVFSCKKLAVTLPTATSKISFCFVFVTLETQRKVCEWDSEHPRDITRHGPNEPHKPEMNLQLKESS